MIVFDLWKQKKLKIYTEEIINIYYYRIIREKKANTSENIKLTKCVDDTCIIGNSENRYYIVKMIKKQSVLIRGKERDIKEKISENYKEIKQC